MPIISLTQEMMDRGKDPEPGWSPAELHEVREIKAKSSDSMNYIFEFQLLGGPERSDVNKGRFQSMLISAKALKTNVREAIQQFQTMAAALTGQNPNELSADDYDTDKWKGLTCWIKISVVMIDGKPNFQITDMCKDATVPF